MGAQLNQEYIKQKLINWEQAFPVNEWHIEGVDIWPYLRIKLYIFLLNQSDNESYPVKKLNDKVKKSNASARIVHHIAYFLHSVMGSYFFFKKLKPKSVIFFGAHFHRTLQNGMYFNRFFDPMIVAHHLKEKVYFIEYEKVFDNLYNPEGVIELHKYLDRYKFLAKIKDKFKLSSTINEYNLREYDIFYSELINIFPGAIALKISESHLHRWTSKVNSSKDFFLKVYRKVKPEKLLFLSYYGYDDLAAAIIAGHELGIKSIDFQHGPQTNVHMAYSAWTKHPEKPYNTMPIEYWNWDEKSKENIEEWARKTEFIKVKNVGHPYLAYFKKKILVQDMEDIIFFSLQTLSLEEMFPAVLLNIMKELEMKWILRAHPRSNFTKNDLESFLIKNNIPKHIYKIENALKTPLPESLAGTKLHITNFSGCVIEAGMLNIPSILIHESGKEIFAAYIDDKSVYYLNPEDPGFKESFKNILENLPEGNNETKFLEIPNPTI